MKANERLLKIQLTKAYRVVYQQARLRLNPQVYVGMFTRSLLRLYLFFSIDGTHSKASAEIL